MNYVAAFAIILTGTVLSALKDDGDTRWLMVSDANVALALFIAWCLRSKDGRAGFVLTINVNAKRGSGYDS